MGYFKKTAFCENGKGQKLSPKAALNFKISNANETLQNWRSKSLLLTTLNFNYI